MADYSFFSGSYGAIVTDLGKCSEKSRENVVKISGKCSGNCRENVASFMEKM
jgi:hypothetical protein